MNEFIDDFDYNNLESEFKQFMNAYGHKYPMMEMENIIDTFFSNKYCSRRVMTQIYDYLGLINDKYNPYKQLVNIIEAHFDLNIDITEIGCGYFPSLSRKIDIIQRKHKNGSISCYDPDLVTTNYGEIKLHKQYFSFDKNIDSSLIIGSSICESTIPFLDYAVKNNKEACLEVCLCNCDVYIDRQKSIEEQFVDYENYLYNRFNDQISNGFKLDREHVYSTDRLASPVILIKKMS